VTRQYLQDMPYADVPIANLTAVTATSETALFSAAQYAPIPANDARAGKVYLLRAGGIMSTAGSGTLTITPRIGTTTGGTTLGASPAQTVVINLTNVAWVMDFTLAVRTIGAPGANSTCIGTGNFQANGAAATAGSNLSVAFGGTSATVDFSVAQGMFIGWTLSVAGTVTPQWITWQSLN
jgi:hypothetical protein